MIQSKKIAKKQANEYPYRQISLIKHKGTSGRVKLFEPRNFIAKYNNIGTPKPKLYTIITPYLTN